MLQVGVVTLLPEIMQSLNYGIPGRAQQKHLWQLRCWNPRDFTDDAHRTVDDRPYGGGPGMVMMVQPLQDAIQAAKSTLGQQTKVVYLSPQGQRFNQSSARQFAQQESLIFVAGRYEGIDERLIALAIDEQWSIGDYVLSGGELATCVVVDAIVRHLPGALQDAQSAQQDSFVDGLLDYPHYTRPNVVQGLSVPSVLMSGNHIKIARWRKKQALGQTWQQRPDLLQQYQLTENEQALLDEYIKENGSEP